MNLPSDSMEINWQKEQLVDHESKKCKKQHQSPSNNKKSKSCEQLMAPDSASCSNSETSLVSLELRPSSPSPSLKDKKKEKKRIHKEKKLQKKIEKKLKKEKRNIEKAKRKQLKKSKREEKKAEKQLKKLKKINSSNNVDDCGVPIDLMFTKAKAPQTPEEYEAQQKLIRRVTDPETGRTRLIKGEGEILEEIVSRDKHREINATATRSDGEFFQSKTVGWNVQ